MYGVAIDGHPLFNTPAFGSPYRKKISGGQEPGFLRPVMAQYVPEQVGLLSYYHVVMKGKRGPIA